MGFSGHHKNKNKTYFRCGIVGHKINKCTFLSARRPVVTTTTTTTTTIPKTTIEEIHSESEKKNPDQKHSQELKLFHGNSEQKWGKFQGKMDGPPFLLSILINQIKFFNVLWDTGCLFYGIVDFESVTKYLLKRMKITPRNMQCYDGSTNGVCDGIILIWFDINGHVDNSFCYVVFKIKYNLILGKP